jgi:hypothetical protein
MRVDSTRRLTRLVSESLHSNLPTLARRREIKEPLARHILKKLRA